MNVKKYKIINTTVKPPKLNPRTGADMRTMTDKVGYTVSVRTDKNEMIMVDKLRPKIVDHLNEGMLRLMRGGFIRIEQIDDVTSILKQHTLNKKDPDLFTPDSAVVAEMPTHPSVTNKKDKDAAKVSEMGYSDPAAEKVAAEGDGINPDGEPNFVAKTSKNLKRKHRFEKDAVQ